MNYTTGELDMAVRLAAFDFLGAQARLHPDALPWRVLTEGFSFEGRRVPLLGPSGIFKPAVLEIPLSIMTAPPVPGRRPPYEDSVGPDGTFIYRYRGTDRTNINHPDNRGLRAAMELHRPLIYFFGTTRGWYHALWPVYIVGDDPKSLSFRVEADEPGSVGKAIEATDAVSPEDRRRYVTRGVRMRLHQVAFSQQVINAYREQCTVCHLKHRELLDAAHILADGSPRGLPIVSNGLAMCKLHHAAFDGHILGVRPDLRIEIREDVLSESDGPMLKHGLQGFQGGVISVPRRLELKPNPEFLEERFALFQKAS